MFVSGRTYKTPKIPFNLVYVNYKTAIGIKVAKRVQKAVVAYYRSYGIRLVMGEFMVVGNDFPEHSRGCENNKYCCQDYECLRSEMLNYYFDAKDLGLRKPYTLTHTLAPKVIVYEKEVLGGLQIKHYHEGGYSYSNGAETINGKATYRHTLNGVGHETGHQMYLEHITVPEENIMNSGALYELEEFSGKFLPLLDESLKTIIKKVNRWYSRK